MVKYKISWTENYETEIETDLELEDYDLYNMIDFENKSSMYIGLESLETELIDEKEIEDDN